MEGSNSSNNVEVNKLVEELLPTKPKPTEEVIYDKNNCRLVKRLDGYYVSYRGKEIVINITSRDINTIKELVRLSLMSLGITGLDLFNLTNEVSEALVSKLNEFKAIEEALEGKLNLAKIASALVNYFKSKYMIKTPVIGGFKVGVYCFREGAYVNCEEEIGSRLNEIYNSLNMEEKGVKYRSLKAEFFTQLEDATKVFRGFDHNLLLFNNGVLNWDLIERGDYRLLEPNPDLMILHKIPHNIDISLLSKCANSLEDCIKAETPFYHKVFSDWVNEKWILLYEIIGYTLYSKGYPFNKAIMLVGEGSNGKSTYLALLKEILGRDNVVSIPLQDLTEERFARAELFGKLANISGEIPKEPLRNTDRFKDLTGEDFLCSDRKFKSRLCFTNYAKLIFSTNELPRTRDMTPAFWRRWLVIQFPNKFPPNPDFKEKVVKNPEIPKLIALSILAFKKVLERGKFSFEESEADYKEIWLRNTDSVYAFIQDLLTEGIDDVIGIKDPNARVESSQLYSLFVKYCEERDLEVLAKKTFTERLERLGYPLVIVMGKRYYKGITIKPKDTPDLKDLTQL